MDIKDAIVKRFLELCKERNIKINELASLSGVTPSTAYSMLDEKRRDTSIRTIKSFVTDLRFLSEISFVRSCLITLSRR